MMLNSWLLTQNCWNNLLPNFLVLCTQNFRSPRLSASDREKMRSRRPFQGMKPAPIQQMWFDSIKFPGNLPHWFSKKLGQIQVCPWLDQDQKLNKNIPGHPVFAASSKVLRNSAPSPAQLRHPAIISKATIACAFCAIGIRPEWGTRSEMFHEWFVEWMLCILNLDFPSSNK